MAHIYIAFVDTPGLFASLIRKYLKQRYVHVVISGDADLTEAYSVGRRNPAVPVIAGFEKEDKVKILHRFPTAFYRVLTVHGRVLPPMKKGNRQKWIVHIGSFAAVMVLTFWRVFRNQDFAGMAASIRKLSMLSVAKAVFLAVVFVAGEGCMIWYLLKGIGEKTSLRRCISYSFIGFFFSGITPSATGGQPMQLYYMRKDGSALSSASVVLMTVAVLYKFVLALTGIGILLFGRQSLKSYFQGYGLLYLLGLFLNIAVVAALILVMFSPEIIKAAFFKTERLLLYLKLWKKSELRKNKMEQFLSGYQETVSFLRNHKKMIGAVAIGTFAQRFSLFLLTYVIYRGLGLQGFSMWEIVWLQAAVYIAVDMLPVPGAQGITEAMFQSVFKSIFTEQYLVAAICITRGISFYLIMLLGFGVFNVRYFRKC